ncbi:MAG: nuclear transport factor 2 family protein [Acidimicrobiales bacterium]
MNPDQLVDLYEIQKLKARYFRLMDTKQWDEWRDLFTDDMELYLENSPLPESDAPTLVGGDALVAYLSASHPDKLTVHQGHMPEIEFVDRDTATGIWAMFDWVDDPGRRGAWQGYGHYHERYVRCPDGRWRIASVRLTRLRVNAVPPQPSEATTGLDPGQLRSSQPAHRGEDVGGD